MSSENKILPGGLVLDLIYEMPSSDPQFSYFVSIHEKETELSSILIETAHWLSIERYNKETGVENARLHLELNGQLIKDNNSWEMAPDDANSSIDITEATRLAIMQDFLNMLNSESEISNLFNNTGFLEVADSNGSYKIVESEKSCRKFKKFFEIYLGDDFNLQDEPLSPHSKAHADVKLGGSELDENLTDSFVILQE